MFRETLLTLFLFYRSFVFVLTHSARNVRVSFVSRFARAHRPVVLDVAFGVRATVARISAESIDTGRIGGAVGV